MAYHILRRILTFTRIPLVYGSSAPLDNILYHENVPMIIQNLGSNGYLSLIYSLIAHSIKQSLKSIVWTIPSNRQSPKIVAWTIPINRQSQKSIADTIVY